MEATLARDHFLRTCIRGGGNQMQGHTFAPGTTRQGEQGGGARGGVDEADAQDNPTDATPPPPQPRPRDWHWLSPLRLEITSSPQPDEGEDEGDPAPAMCPRRNLTSQYPPSNDKTRPTSIEPPTTTTVLSIQALGKCRILLRATSSSSQ